MPGKALIANTAWWMSCLPAWWRFRRALGCPKITQRSVLARLVRNAAQTAFGREHQFDRIRDYDDFISRVPIRDYDAFDPYIDRIRRGEQHVLTPDRVIRFATTSGTTSGRKLIPYTRKLQQEFTAAIGPWIVDLFHSDARIMAGPAYWSISPAIRDERNEDSAVPIGFEEDSEYLGGIARRIIDWAMAVPADVRHAPGLEAFRDATLAHLLKRPDLRLVSIWHPSFLSILLDHRIESPLDVWPNLRLISCWADARAKPAAEDLARRFPGIRIQPKGLIATEGIISLPFRSQFPLAVTSHFLEFIDERGRIWTADQLVNGGCYEVVVTTGGGLWRYRLSDLVRVEGFIQKTPSIRFIGKTGSVSDLFGEKLSEAFVVQVLDQLLADGHLKTGFAMLAPERDRYVLYLQDPPARSIQVRVDELLRGNPQYAYCRDLGQLAAVRVFRVHGDAHPAVLRRLTINGQRLGDIKPMALSRLGEWQQHFQGEFVD